MRYKCSECSALLDGRDGTRDDHGFAAYYPTPIEEQASVIDPSSLYFCGRRNVDAVAEVITEDPRPSREKLFLDIAGIISKRSTCTRAHVGCVIAKDGRIISTGYNGSPPGAAHCSEVGCLAGPDSGCIRTTHAEINAIVWAARSGVATEGAEIYGTHGPCLACAKAIATAGLKRVYFIEPYRLEDGVELLSQLGIQVFQYQEV